MADDQQITNKTTNKSSLIEHLNIDNIEVYNATEIAYEFTRYFSSIGETYANKIGKPTTSISKYISNIVINPQSIFFNPTSKTEIVNLINKLHSKTSKGYVDITNVMLKQIHSSIVDPLTIIFNKSLEE